MCICFIVFIAYGYYKYSFEYIPCLIFKNQMKTQQMITTFVKSGWWFHHCIYFLCVRYLHVTALTMNVNCVYVKVIDPCLQNWTVLMVPRFSVSNQEESKE